VGAAHASAGETASTVNAELDGLGVHVEARRTRPCSVSRMALAEGLLLLHALLLLGSLSSAWSIKHPCGPASDVSGPAEAACSGGESSATMLARCNSALRMLTADWSWTISAGPELCMLSVSRNRSRGLERAHCSILQRMGVMS
jgi:hypothetical protein